MFKILKKADFSGNKKLDTFPYTFGSVLCKKRIVCALSWAKPLQALYQYNVKKMSYPTKIISLQFYLTVRKERPGNPKWPVSNLSGIKFSRTNKTTVSLQNLVRLYRYSHRLLSARCFAISLSNLGLKNLPMTCNEKGHSGESISETPSHCFFARWLGNLCTKFRGNA